MLLKIKELFRFNLGLFVDPPAVDPPAGDPPAADPPADPPAADPPAADPFATFPDEKSFMARIAREGKKQMASMLEGMGLKDETALKAMLDQKAAADLEGKSDLEKALQRQADLILERDTAINKNNSNIRNSEIQTAATTAGVKPEKVSYLMKLMDLENLDVIDGKLDPIAVNTQIKKILTDIPELGSIKPDLPGAGGGSFDGDNKEPLSYDLIRKMSAEEVTKRLPQINEFMKSHPLKK